MADVNTALTLTDRVMVIRRDSNGVGTEGSITPDKIYEGIGLGYQTGAGIFVIQSTSRTTSVTANTYCGRIQLDLAAGTTTPTSFTVLNDKIKATDVIVVNQATGIDLYEIHITAVTTGQFQITFFTTGGTTAERPEFNFAIVGAVSS